jgi:hypothetical protein
MAISGQSLSQPFASPLNLNIVSDIILQDISLRLAAGGSVVPRARNDKASFADSVMPEIALKGALRGALGGTLGKGRSD